MFGMQVDTAVSQQFIESGLVSVLVFSYNKEQDAHGREYRVKF